MSNKNNPKTTNKKNKSGKKEKKGNRQTLIVAIGASAGGLNALERFFKNTPPDEGIAYVVIQHLDPSHKSMLTSILQRDTSMDVQQVEDKMKVEADKIYVIPPGYDMRVEDGIFHLKKQENPRGVRLPIDMFFRSLKSEMHDKAIGIILSGTGSDGTLGLRDIKAENGMIMVQEPDTADHKGMPQSAIDTGLVDFILPPEEMPEKLIEFIHETLYKPSKERHYEQDELEKYTKDIFKILQSETKHDFSDYKQSTVFRRIERRMAVNTVQNLKDYVGYLKDNPSEIDSLFNEFLIGVTSFFRDKEAFERLVKRVFPKIVKQKNDEQIRIWVTGCSTGEEAYSIAILLSKYLTEHKIDRKVQLFASDIDDKSLETARNGKYPLNIQADVPADILQTYFHRKETHYKVQKEIREMVVFANQSIVKDPPHSRIDLISCRNLLIYLKSDMQNRILDIFHYALQKEGFLFLGNSESLGARKDAFRAADSKWKIFQKSENGYAGRTLWAYSGKNYTFQGGKKGEKNDKPKISLKDFAEKQVHEKYMYPFIIIDKEGDIKYSVGKLKGYFEFPHGEPSNNILSAANESLRVQLANALRKIKIEKEKLVYDNVRFSDEDDNVELLKLSVIPVKKPAALSNLFIVLIEPSKSELYSPSGDNKDNEHTDDQDEYIQTLERELHETRDYLQNVIEELETSNEELKSANEEAQSSNEELQSTNEELETSKEELQSLNEELETSNHELQRKVTEITEVNNDINNFITSTQIGVIFLDKDMKIQRFTPSMRKIIDLLDSDIGRPISNFVTKLNYSNLIEDNREVLETLIPKKAEVSVKEEGVYWMRILPYRTIDDKISGTVITFTDISELKKAQKEALQSKERFKTLFEKMNSGIIVVDLIYDKEGRAVDGKIIDANNAYSKQTGIPKEKVTGRNINDVFPNYRVDLFQKLMRVAETNEPFFSVEYVPQFDKHLSISAYSFQRNQYIAIFDDITDQIKAQEAVIENEEKFRELFKSLNQGIVITNVLRKKGQKPEFYVERVNRAFERITGISGRKINNKNLLQILSESGIEMIDWESQMQKKGVSEKEIFWKEKEKHLRLSSFAIQKKLNVLVVQDITNEKNELISRNHLASIVEFSDDAIYSVAPDGTVVSWNKGAENFYGYTHDEIIGKNISLLSGDQANAGIHEKLIAKVKTGKTIKNYELKQHNKYGAKISVSLTKSPILNEKGEVVAISDVVKDMTKIKKREQQLINAKEKTEQASLLKTTFLQNISHEIRTPMNSIIGFTDILKKRIKDDGELKYMHAIEESGHQLIRLIDDILDLSRLETGAISITKSVFNLPDVMQQLKERFEGIENKRNKTDLKLVLDLPEDDTKRTLYTDVDRLQQILTNLLSNAIKYTEKGEVVFGYRDEDEKILFFVKDTGKGIKKEYLDIIFERFERAGIETQDVFSGTGLGLSISKGLTEMLGGKIWCESEEEKGSSFYFTIPDEEHTVPEETEKKSPAGKEEDQVPDLSGKTILIAEDDEFSFQMLEALFIPTNAQILHAYDGEKAIELAKNNAVDLALLDIRLPKKSGYEIMEEFKNMKLEFPVIAQTAYAMPDDKKKIHTNGFTDMVTKPLTAKELFQVIRKYINQ